MFACVYVCETCVCLTPTKDKRGCQIPWEWSYRRFRSSVRAKYPLQHWVYSPTHRFNVIHSIAFIAVGNIFWVPGIYNSSLNYWDIQILVRSYPEHVRIQQKKMLRFAVNANQGAHDIGELIQTIRASGQCFHCSVQWNPFLAAGIKSIPNFCYV